MRHLSSVLLIERGLEFRDISRKDIKFGFHYSVLNIGPNMQFGSHKSVLSSDKGVFGTEHNLMFSSGNGLSGI